MFQFVAAALAAGVGAGLKDTTSSVIRDAYTGLREALRRRLASRGSQAVQALDAEETEPGVWQAQLGEDLAATGADHDEQILAVAGELLAALGKPRSSGKTPSCSTNGSP